VPSFQEIAAGVSGIGKVHPFGINIIHEQGFLKVQGIVWLLDPRGYFSDGVAGDKQKKSGENESVHIQNCITDLNYGFTTTTSRMIEVNLMM
jgi:hypothetical protein